MNDQPRVVFFGTPEFAVPSLATLRKLPIELVGVVAQPAKPAGRGHTVIASPVELAARAADIPVATPASLKTNPGEVSQWLSQADVAVVVAYGKLIPHTLLGLPPAGFVNIHPSLLPRHRGPSPIQAAILGGDTETGVTLMKLDDGMDTGPIIAQVSHPLNVHTTAPELTSRLARVGAELLAHELLPFLNGQRPLRPQSQDGATVCRLLTKEDGKLDWTQPADVLERKIRALQPWPGTWTLWQGEPMRIFHARVTPDNGTPGQALPTAPLRIACGTGALEIGQLQLPGKPVIDAASAVRGYALLGATFGI